MPFPLLQKCGHQGFSYVLEAGKSPPFPGFADKLSAPIQLKWFVNCFGRHQQLQTVNSGSINMLVRTTVTVQTTALVEKSLKTRLLSVEEQRNSTPAPAHILPQKDLPCICWQTLADVSARWKVFCLYSNILQIKPNELCLTKKCHVASLQGCPSVGLAEQQRAAAVLLCAYRIKIKQCTPESGMINGPANCLTRVSHCSWSVSLCRAA